MKIQFFDHSQNWYERLKIEFPISAHPTQIGRRLQKATPLSKIEFSRPDAIGSLDYKPATYYLNDRLSALTDIRSEVIPQIVCNTNSE